MAKIVFRLNGVPEAEGNAIRELLSTHQIEYYETSEGRWGVSVGALWVKNNDDFTPARELIDAYQSHHADAMRQQFRLDKAEGRIPSFWQLLKANPFMFLLYWLIILAVATITILPMFHFFN